MRRQNRPIEQVLLRRRTAVDDIRVSNMLLLQPHILMERWRQQTKPGIRPALALLDEVGDHGELLQQAGGVAGEASVNDVDVLYGAAAHHQGQSHVPVGLQAAAEDGDGFDMGAAGEKTG